MSHLNMSQFATRYDFEKAQAEHAGKQLVMYESAENVRIGDCAYVIPIDHPDTYRVTNGRVARTTQVNWHNTETGVFETLNSRYVPQSLVK